MKKLKKGFTLVELVIVIAVIAILAAVLVPTFSGVVQNAKIAKDKNDCGEINQVLSLSTIEEMTMSDVLYQLSTSNIATKRLIPTASGYHYAWNESLNRIVYLDNNFKVVNEEDTVTPNKSWIVASNASEFGKIAQNGFNVYLIGNITSSCTITNLVSVDTGAYKMTSLTIATETAGDATNTVKLSGTFDNVTLNIPNASAVQKNGMIKNLTVTAVHYGTLTLQGYVKDLSVNQGKVAIAKSASVDKLNVNVTAEKAVAIFNKGVVAKVEAFNQSATGASATFTNEAGAVIKAVDSEVSGITPTASDVKHTTEITSRADLENFRDQVNSGRTFAGEIVALTEDIDLTGIAWTPISNYYRIEYSEAEDAKKVLFQGTFDGGNKTIIGLSNTGFAIAGLNAGTNGSSASFNGRVYDEAVYGLFGSVWNAEIHRLNIAKASIDMTIDNDAHRVGDSVATIVGYAGGDTFKMTECTVDNQSTVSSYDSAAGLVGRIYAKDVTIEDCTNSAKITSYRHVAGVVGYISKNTSVTITDCTNTAQIKNLGCMADPSRAKNKGVPYNDGESYYIAKAIATTASGNSTPSSANQNSNHNTGTIMIGEKSLTNEVANWFGSSNVIPA